MQTIASKLAVNQHWFPFTLTLKNNRLITINFKVTYQKMIIISTAKESLTILFLLMVKVAESHKLVQDHMNERASPVPIFTFI